MFKRLDVILPNSSNSTKRSENKMFTKIIYNNDDLDVGRVLLCTTETNSPLARCLLRILIFKT